MTVLPSAAAMPSGAALRPPPPLIQVVLRLQPGGAEYLVCEMSRRLRSRYDVSVCCLDDEGDWSAALRGDGVPVDALHRQQGFRPSVARRIAAMARARGARVLHCHQYSPFVYGCLARLWYPTLQVIYTEHGRLSDAPPPRKRRLANPWLARLSGPIAAVSHELRGYLVRAGFPARQLSVVHNGIDPGPAPNEQARRHARVLLGLSEDMFVITAVARLDPVKDLHTLLDAYAAIRHALPYSRLVIVGDGAARPALERRAASAELAGSVAFLGMRGDTRALLPAADVFVNTSISEGISITILEALAAGVPVVATAVGGTPEILSTPEVGILVPPRDAPAVAAAVLALASDTPGARALGAAGRRRLENAFTIDRMVNAYCELYDQLLR